MNVSEPRRHLPNKFARIHWNEFRLPFNVINNQIRLGKNVTGLIQQPGLRHRYSIDMQCLQQFELVFGDIRVMSDSPFARSTDDDFRRLAIRPVDLKRGHIC